jgi:UDP-N-acetylglucosamine 2-epimerase (non-hydrolysing)
MEAGNRSFDERVPEEINRKILDHISDINLPYSDIAREYLLKEGLSPDRIIKIGSPMAEVYYEHFKANSFIFPEKWTKDILEKFNLEKNKFYLFSLHREESIENEKQINKLINVLTWMDENLQYPIIFSTHPRTKNRLTTLGVIDSFKNIKFMKPFSLTEYVALQINASIVFSDSGTISEETSLLQLKSLNLREAHERPEAMEEATVMMVGLDLERIKQGIDILNSGHGFSSYVADYTRHSIASKVLKIIISYTDYVKRNVWREEPHE